MNHPTVPVKQRSLALKYYYANLEANRAASRVRSKAAYYLNKEAKLLKSAEYRRNNPAKWKLIKQVSNKKYHKRRFFFVRAMHHALRVNDKDEAIIICSALSRAWYNQRGRCAYTGRKLDRTAQVDHKTPVSRGGTNDPSNLHWVCAEANWVKQDKTHEEFIALCADITAYIDAHKPTKPPYSPR
jgi:hypothetical protein